MTSPKGKMCMDDKFPELPDPIRDTIENQLDFAEQVQIALGWPPEAKYDVLRAIFYRDNSQAHLPSQDSDQINETSSNQTIEDKVRQFLSRLNNTEDEIPSTDSPIKELIDVNPSQVDDALRQLSDNSSNISTTTEDRIRKII